ncbi:MAG TPA: cysteine--tRNA ligase [Desulfotomaculum sp.]|nr:cysteine--tRNA ligase [Desulfotomaculum sp.]
MKIYNTLTKAKEDFKPRQPGKVFIYVCGPTTYNFIHLGNARSFVFFDTVRRYFRYRGYEVKYVQNFTDMDDKIINRAREEKEDPLFLAEKYVQAYFYDTQALNVQKADIHPKVSQHIPEIVDLIKVLIEKKHAYLADQDVYFDIATFTDYGKLSGRSLDFMQAGARVEVDVRKKNPLDFALWKAAKPGEPFWESPWGLGRPGWHIECTAMALKYLGTGFDIHGGGNDLIFPHHENEIAQAEAATEQPFARYWLHNGYLTVNQEKMSKSLGNYFLVREILKKFSSETIRFFLLSTHYRSPQDFSEENLNNAARGLERLKTSIILLQEALVRPGWGDAFRSSSLEFQDMGGREAAFLATLSKLESDFIAAMDDDFNTALALSKLFDLAREVNIYLTQKPETKNQNLPQLTVIELQNKQNAQVALVKAKELFGSFNGVLGIFKANAQGDIILERSFQERDTLVEPLVNLIIQLRQEARVKKDWAGADKIRNSLKELGVVLEDTKDGVRWKLRENNRPIV